MFIADIQAAIEMDVVALGRDPQRGRLSASCPYARAGRLEIETHLIYRHNYPLRVVLQKIGHFFSSCCSNSASCAALGWER